MQLLSLASADALVRGRRQWDTAVQSIAGMSCEPPSSDLLLCPPLGRRWVSVTDVRLPASTPVSGRFTMATNDPNLAACKRHGGRTSGSGRARPRHRSRRVSLVG